MQIQHFLPYKECTYLILSGNSEEVKKQDRQKRHFMKVLQSMVKNLSRTTVTEVVVLTIQPCPYMLRSTPCASSVITVELAVAAVGCHNVSLTQHDVINNIITVKNSSKLVQTPLLYENICSVHWIQCG